MVGAEFFACVCAGNEARGVLFGSVPLPGPLELSVMGSRLVTAGLRKVALLFAEALFDCCLAFDDAVGAVRWFE